MFPGPIITAAMSAPGQPGSPSARLERGKSAIGDYSYRFGAIRVTRVRFGAIRERMASVRYLYEYRGGGAGNSSYERLAVRARHAKFNPSLILKDHFRPAHSISGARFPHITDYRIHRENPVMHI